MTALLPRVLSIPFSPLLTKKLFWKDPPDWKVWHFHGDLPVALSGPGDIAYVTTQWMRSM